MEQNLGPDTQQKQQESVVVFDSHAVVDPRAMMVKSLHTTVTDSAMTRSRGPDYFALRAQVSWVNHFQQV